MRTGLIGLLLIGCGVLLAADPPELIEAREAAAAAKRSAEQARAAVMKLEQRLGVTAAAPRSDQQAFLGLSSQRQRQDDEPGLMIMHVVPGSAAAQAGLAAGDELLQFDDQLLFATSQLATLVRRAGVGTGVVLTRQRDGVEEQVSVELGAGPVRPRTQPRVYEYDDHLGMTYDLQRQIDEARRQLDLRLLEPPAPLPDPDELD